MAPAAYDPVQAAALEVEWWRAHREDQHGGGAAAHAGLVAALQALYAYTYGVDAGAVVRGPAGRRAPLKTGRTRAVG